MEVPFMFGSRFKKLRIAQNISLQQAAHNVINPSSLSRWENNQNELRFDVVIELLNNIHISPLEFLSITVITPHTPVIEEVNSAQDSPLELKRLASKYLTIYEDSKNKHDLFSAAIVCNFYYEVSNKNIFPKKYKEILQETLSNTLYWSHYYVSIFGNTMHLLDTKFIYGFAMMIMNSIQDYKSAGFENFLDTLDTLLNAYLNLIERDLIKATALSTKFNSLHLSEYALQTRIYLKFFNALLNYRHSKDSATVISIIKALHTLDQDDLVTKFQEIFDEIRRIS